MAGPNKPVRLIAIAGGSGSGKTTLATLAAARLRSTGELVTLISDDRYYRCASTITDFDPTVWNFDHPDAKDFAALAADLAAIKAGIAVDAPVYDFATHRRDSARLDRLSPAPILIVEGILALHDARVRALVDFAVFVAAPEGLRLERRMARDIATRGRTPDSVRAQFAATVAPMHAAFVEPQRERADLVLDTGEDAVEATLTRLLLALGASRALAGAD
jgi:uridine kinase